MNTRIQYLYRDGANNKAYPTLDVVVRGPASESHENRIRCALDEFGGFIAAQVGLPETFLVDLRGEAPICGVDHPWHTWLALDPTRDPATDPRTVEDLVQAFERACEQEWNDTLDTPDAAPPCDNDGSAPLELAGAGEVFHLVLGANHGRARAPISVRAGNVCAAITRAIEQAKRGEVEWSWADPLNPEDSLYDVDVDEVFF